MSRKYESSGNPATIANNPGDIGGKSYGSYQIIKSNMPNFLNYLKDADSTAYANFSGKTIGGTTFDQAWKDYAAKEPEQFERLQHNYILATHYAPAVGKVEKATGLNIADRSKAVQDVLWSTSVQHGPGGAATVFKNAGITASMSDAQIIQRVYAERGADNGTKYFSSSSDSVRKGVVNRFKSELIDALKMLKG
ncbi:hypothetical protein [Paenibacillus sp. P32E]|uniref:VgrG-related protein n=1 Tax=Paenibacillus sp. P32E TaxID=1349434 RepID=UPI00093E4C45|nr:hypothetical protein [Paenibacillus sp. P32E]OKP91424.1 hypothetical protein A3848_09995 [Paenibacillus sp. P32E]